MEELVSVIKLAIITKTDTYECYYCNR